GCCPLSARFPYTTLFRSIEDDKWLERPLACVVPSDPSLTEDELRMHLLEQGFLKFWIPDTFLFVPEVPKTSVGKYDKKAIRGVVDRKSTRLNSSHVKISY